MGAVYLALQTSLDRDVALKLMHAQWADDPVFLARFTRQAYAAAQLNHHNVVQIYDFGADAGVHFFSMEFVDGRSLGDLLKRGQLSPAEAVGYVMQAARGLKFAHDRGMVHRDVKPNNLLLNAEGLVKVADLGLVRTQGMTADDDRQTHAGDKLRGTADVTAAGTAMGSPSYMSPEQCRDATAVDPRADVYSLGCTLYALLSGRTPFVGRSAVEVIRQHLSVPPPPLARVAPDVPAALADIVGKGLQKDPADRSQGVDELISALASWQAAQASGPPRRRRSN
jgi:serine/threonine protein kinase